MSRFHMFPFGLRFLGFNKIRGQYTNFEFPESPKVAQISACDILFKEFSDIRLRWKDEK